ncbi:transposon Ty3-I Gag-Pol polyprotein [Trichonephila clavipes]|nr:transposon Ty3-I Gag-Pol polyprotein [Trichonephila clavipes]
MALYRSSLTVSLWPSSFFEEGLPPAHKAHQTVSFSGCNGVSTYTCGLASLQMRQFCLLTDLTRKGIIIGYLDDLVIPAKNEQEGLEKLKIIFEVAKKYGLEIKFKKCQFLKKKIEFLGHIVESGTIKPSSTKTLAVRKFPEPTTIKQVQSFLGLTGYFRKYIKDYSNIAKPLSDLTREKKTSLFFGTQQKKHLKN